MKTIYLLKIAILLLVTIGIPFVIFSFRNLIKAEQERKKNELVLKTKVKSRKVYKAYKFLIRFKLTRKFLMRLQRIYEIRIPGDIRQSREKATKVAMIIWSAVAVAVAGLLIFKPSYLVCLTVLYTVYIVADQIIQRDVAKFDAKLIKELSVFIDDVRHQYFVTGMVDLAIEGALEKTTPLMKIHGQLILDVITDDDPDNALAKYCDTVPNYFIKMFADTCAKVMQFGDKIIDDQSLFLTSIQNLKEEIQAEVLFQNALKNKFLALIPISVVPVYAIGPLKSFCISSFTPLKDLFNGSYGLFTTVGSFIFSLVIYKVILRLRNAVKVDMQDVSSWRNLYNTPVVKKAVNQVLAKNWGKTLRMRELLRKTGSVFDEKLFMVKRCTYFVVVGVLSFALFVVSHVMNKQIYATSVDSVASTTSGASDDELFMMLLVSRQLLEDHRGTDYRKMYNALNKGNATMTFDSDVASYLQTILSDKVNFETIEIDEELAFSQIEVFAQEHSSSTSAFMQLNKMSYEDVINSSDAMVTSGLANFRNLVALAEVPSESLNQDELAIVAEEVTKQIQKYQNEYFHWYDLMFVVLFALVGYNAPVWILMFEKKALQADMEDEIIQFKSSIMVLMHFGRMDVDIILDSIHMLSRIFQPSLQKCINTMPLGEDVAFEQLIDDEPFDSFKRLIENLKMVDKVGVEKAFSTIKSERRNYQETRKQENEFNSSEKGALAGFISLFPCYLVILLFMAVPFVYEAISEFQGALQDMQTFL